MQVKKFEARSMREALEMVKFHLGPEAIILSARDNSKGFGLAGEKSVEVTAAVSEETLKRKIIAERKMNEEAKFKYNQSPARIQKEFIDKASMAKKEPGVRRPMTSTPYIDIVNELEAQERVSVPTESLVQPVAGATRPAAKSIVTQGRIETDSSLAEERIRLAVMRALSADLSTLEGPAPVKEKSKQRIAEKSDGAEVKALREEILYLKNILDRFQKVPQSFVSRHPGADYDLPYEMSSTFEKFRRAGISEEYTVEILKECLKKLDPANIKKKAFVEAWAAKYLLDNVLIAERRTQDRFHAFVGPAGQGKTSSLVKLASHLVICEKKKIAILSTDNAKVGASEQLKIYAQILNVPFATLRRKKDWDIIQSKLSMVDHFLIDFPGMNLRSIGELDFLRDLMPPMEGGRSVHYVQSALAKDADAFEIANRYMTLGFDDAIFTCLDESAQHGLIYNFQKKFGVPLHSFGIGPKIPEDLEAATKERVVDLIFKLTKLRKS